MVESTEIRLMLLDVRATDGKGRPMPGLGLPDFAVSVDGRARPVYSVDDFCPCGQGAERNRERREGPRLQEEKSVAASPAAPEPLQFVLYLDFSQLRMDGRARAVEEARRWIRETLAPGDRAMLVAYAEGAGVKILYPFGGDKAKLLEAVDRAQGDVKLIDPFPSFREAKIELCEHLCTADRAGCDACYQDLARAEYRHSRHSLESLRWFLARLADTPGRKALVLFNQDGTMFPARYYPVDESMIGDHVSLVDQVGAEATLSRTSIYAAFSGGDANPLATNLGANLADFTGGGYNRGASDLSRFVRDAARGCECIYRIGIVPAANDHGRVHRVAVDARDRRLPNVYRVQYLNASDRWMRSAQAVLADPGASQDVPIVAAIVPVLLGKDGWDVRIQVALDPGALQVIRAAPGSTNADENWEVGALLVQGDGGPSWEMVAVSELHGGLERTAALPTILHERTLEGLRPGAYELRAFVRDRWTNLYGAATARLDLAKIKEGALTGPLMFGTERALVRTALPLAREGAHASPLATRVTVNGSLPLGERPPGPGDPLEFLTWICSGESNRAARDALRFLSRDGKPVLGFDAPRIEAAGACIRLGDSLDTSTLVPGHYAYQLRFTPGPTDAAPHEVELQFEIAPPALPQE